MGQRHPLFIVLFFKKSPECGKPCTGLRLGFGVFSKSVTVLFLQYVRAFSWGWDSNLPPWPREDLERNNQHAGCGQVCDQGLSGVRSLWIPEGGEWFGWYLISNLIIIECKTFWSYILSKSIILSVTCHCCAGFARHHSHWRTDISEHSVGLRREAENFALQGVFGKNNNNLYKSALFKGLTSLTYWFLYVCRSCVWSASSQPQRKRRWHMSLSSLTSAAGKNLVWWPTTTVESKTSISSHWAQRTHYPPNSYRLMGQVSVHRVTQIP